MLFIYDTVAELQKAAMRYSHEGEDFWKGAAGCFQPKFTVAYKKNKVTKKYEPVRTRKTSFIGVMRLCVPHLTREVIIHESVHAAINLVRASVLDVEFDLHDETGIYEEALAFATQHISETLIRAIKPVDATRWKAIPA